MAYELRKLSTGDEFNAQLESRAQRRVPDRRMAERRKEPVQLGPRPSDGRPESALEQQFPRIAQALTATWRSKTCALFLGDLIINDRLDRQGFSYDVLEELLLLSELNSTLINPVPILGDKHRRDPPMPEWLSRRRAVFD